MVRAVPVVDTYGRFLGVLGRRMLAAQENIFGLILLNYGMRHELTIVSSKTPLHQIRSVCVF